MREFLLPKYIHRTLNFILFFLLKIFREKRTEFVIFHVYYYK